MLLLSNYLKQYEILDRLLYKTLRCLLLLPRYVFEINLFESIHHLRHLCFLDRRNMDFLGLKIWAHRLIYYRSCLFSYFLLFSNNLTLFLIYINWFYYFLFFLLIICEKFFVYWYFTSKFYFFFFNCSAHLIISVIYIIYKLLL